MCLSTWRIRFFVFMVWVLLVHERFLGEAMVLLVFRAQIDSFCRHETLVWVLDPDSLFSDCSSSAKRALYSSV